jgi:hypothetical protein
MDRLCSAYVGLTLARGRHDGSRTMSLARFGTFEVRVLELADRETTDFWIELYCHYTRSSLDSCTCCKIDDAEPLAEHLILSAQQLNRAYHESGQYLH